MTKYFEVIGGPIGGGLIAPLLVTLRNFTRDLWSLGGFSVGINLPRPYYCPMLLLSYFEGISPSR